MFFEEKIELLKQHFSDDDFKIPFNHASRILKSIEKEFIIVKDLASSLNNLGQYHSNWAENIKKKVSIRSVSIYQTDLWLGLLDKGQNYWVVLSAGSSKHLIYDCKPNAIASLISIAGTDFFIVDKKYSWFSYFQLDRQTKNVTIYKSGEQMTPFEIPGESVNARP